MFLDYMSAAVLIFFAEMGDKTQFLAMAFATKYSIKKILIGVAIGSFLNHGLAMILGKGLLSVMPKDMISFIAGVMFLFFAFQSLKIDDETVEEKKSKYGPVFTVALAFFIGELGDKTQLAALGLAVDSDHLLFSLLGTVTGMVLTSAIGIFVGLKLGKKIPEDKLKLSAFIIFIIFGVQKLYTSYLNQLNVVLLLLILSLLLLLMIISYRKFNFAYHNMRETSFQLQAAALKSTREKIEIKVINLCKGKENCGVCDGDKCLVGHMKVLLNSINGPVSEKDTKSLMSLKNKTFSYEEAKEILQEILTYYGKFPLEFSENILLVEIRKSVEVIMFEKTIKIKNYDQYKKDIENLMKGRN